MEINQEHIYKFCITIAYMLTFTNMATERKFEVIFDKLHMLIIWTIWTSERYIQKWTTKLHSY